MSVLQSLVSNGFKPTQNEDGLFKALKGTYECTIKTLRPEVDEKNGNAKFYQFELQPVATIEGDEFREGFTFRRRIYVDGDKAEANLKKLLNDLFTCGIELDTTNDESMEASFEKAIGVKAFARAWGWKPEGKDSEAQMFVIQQEKVALKKKKSEVPF